MADQPKHRNTREALIQAGINEINEYGVANLSMRRIAKACGNTIVAGIDAHDPNCFFQPETFEPYQKFVAACGLTVTDEITLRPVKR